MIKRFYLLPSLFHVLVFGVALASNVRGQFDSLNMQLLAEVPNPTGSSSEDVWGWTDSVTGIDYAMIGSGVGVDIYSLEDPTQPDYKGRWLTNGFDFKVYGDYAYSVRHVIDLSVVRGVTSPQNFVSDATYFSSGFHNVFINEETGVLYGSCPGILAYDLDESLIAAASVDSAPGGGCHDAMSVVYHGPDTRYTG